MSVNTFLSFRSTRFIRHLSYLIGIGHSHQFVYFLLFLVLGEVCKVSDVSHRQRRCKLNYNVIGQSP